MNNKQRSYSISVGGALTAMTVFCQSAPIFLSSVGLLISPFSTFPILLASLFSLPLGLSVLFCSAFILTFISVQETLILLFTTGLLGLSIGTLIKRMNKGLTVLFSSLILSLGLTLLTYVVGIDGFKHFTHSFLFPLLLFIYVSFSAIYSSVWVYGIYPVTNRLNHWLKNDNSP